MRGESTKMHSTLFAAALVLLPLTAAAVDAGPIAAPMKTVLVCAVQTPFVTGGAEILVQ